MSDTAAQETWAPPTPRELTCIETLGELFLRRIHGRQGWEAWRWFVLALPRLAISVLGLGLLAAAATTVVPIGMAEVFSALSDRGHGLTGAVVLAGAVLSVSTLAEIAKAYRESALVTGVGQLAYLAIYRTGLDHVVPAKASDEDREAFGAFTTQPAQLSQLAYTVDLVVSVIQGLALTVVIVIEDGLIGVIAVVLLMLLAALSRNLIVLIGELFGRYRSSEQVRQALVKDVSLAGPSTRRRPFQAATLSALARARADQEPILYRRAAALSLDNTLDQGAVIAVVIGAFLLSELLGHIDTAHLLALIVAVMLLYGTLANSLTNYRVIRLAVPVLRAFDELRSASSRTVRPAIDRDADGGSPPLAHAVGLAVVAPDDHAAIGLLRDIAADAVGRGEAVWVPRDPDLPALILDDTTLSATIHPARLLGIASVMARRREPNFLATLSNGERHRLALALALAAEPEKVVAEDIFASLDRGTAHRVAKVLRDTPGLHATVITARPEVWAVADQQLSEHDGFLRARTIGSAERTVIELESEPSDPVVAELPVSSAGTVAPPGEVDWPAPVPSSTDIVRGLFALFGPSGVLGLLVGACWLVGGGLVFAIVAGQTGHAVHVDSLRALSGLCLLATVFGGGLLFAVQFAAPVPRLSALHRRLAPHAVRLADPRNTGVLTGRFGADFSDLQMLVPGTLAKALLGGVQLSAFALAFATGSWVLLLALVPIAAASLTVFRRGRKQIVHASADVARARNAMFALAAETLGSALVSGNRQLAARAQAEYSRRVRHYLLRRWRRDVLTVRRKLLLALLSLATVLVALGLSLALSVGSGLLPAATLVYFAYLLSASVEQLMKNLTSVTTSIAQDQRVRVLLTVDAAAPPADSAPDVSDIVAEIDAAVQQPGRRLIGVTGRTGSGKSLALAVLAMRHDSESVLLLERDLPVSGLRNEDFGEVLDGVENLGQRASLADRQQLLLELAGRDQASLVFLDETTNAMSLERERYALTELRTALQRRRAQAVIVLHRHDNLDLCDDHVAVDGGFAVSRPG